MPQISKRTHRKTAGTYGVAAYGRYLVEYNPLDVANEVRPPVEHRSEDLRGHDQAGSLRIDGHIARDEAHVSETSLSFQKAKTKQKTRQNSIES